jgi:hypothetical protein
MREPKQHFRGLCFTFAIIGGGLGMGQSCFKRNNSGQVLIVSALLVALLLLSTALYVIELEKELPRVDSSQGNVFSRYKQSTQSSLISALANATNGGSSNVLSFDLSELKATILSHSYKTMLTIDYNTLNSSDYQNGIWISWSTNGQGISSAYATFVFASYSPLETSNLEYAVNVTSTVNLSGNYQQLNDTIKQVNLTINLQNEDKPALAQNFAFFYQNATDWTRISTQNTTNFGNGSYTVSFVAESPPLNNPLVVLMLCQDQRGIFVGANVTCAGT